MSFDSWGNCSVIYYKYTQKLLLNTNTFNPKHIRISINVVIIDGVMNT